MSRVQTACSHFPVEKCLFAVALLVALCLTTLVEPANAQVIFSDGTFNNSDWSIVDLAVGNGGTGTGQQITSGGNPGDYRQLTTTVNGPPSGTTDSVIEAIHLQSGASYSPAISGPISSIDYSEDGIMMSSFGQGWGLALVQNGNYYLDTGYDMTQTSWTTTSFTNLQQSDFYLFTGTAAVLDFTKHPDFSPTGSLIDFGFQSENGSGIGDGGGHSYTTITGIDNWSVTLHQAPGAGSTPEPGPLALLAGLGLCSSIFTWRRRRQ